MFKIIFIFTILFNFFMKKSILILLFFVHFSMFSQGESNIWYFGKNAGLDFNSGSPVPLLDGQINTVEGCAAISNNLGQLLFYTDGVKIYNKNHVVMLNGSGLTGHSSSTQSAIIVKKPGSSNLFYVFTVDSLGSTNGFRYSIVDISLDSGLGGVTSEKNVLIYAPSCEKISITKHANNIDYWIVTHSFPGNTFFSHLLTSSGLNTNPTLSNINFNIPFDNIIYSQLKFSPSGNKIAAGCIGTLELMDFNTTTGILSNNIKLSDQNIYGVEFSPNSEILYATIPLLDKIYQFDLNASDILNSKVDIETMFHSYAMQLGPDHKIYIALNESDKLSVISNPNILGSGSTLQESSVSLGNRKSLIGLPSFCQSFFLSPTIQLTNSCEDESTNFSFSTDQTVLNVTWDFGDGNTSNTHNPSHIYQSANDYTVTINITTPNGVLTSTRNITILPKPVLLQNSITLNQCDDNNDGFSAFNLKETEQMLVTSTTGLIISYHETQANADNGSSPITTPITYTNQIVNGDVVFVRVENSYGCFRTAQINLNVSTTSIPSSFQKVFKVCDTNVSGSDTDGIATFDFSSVTPQIEALFPVGQLITIKYYKNLTDALAEQNFITDISNYTNTGYPNMQNIYVRVDSQTNNGCLGLGHHITLYVSPIPKINTTGIELICSNNTNFTKTINAGAINSNEINSFSYQWYLNGNMLIGQTNYTLTINTEGIYTVVVTNAQNCSKTRTVTVTASNIATIENITITDLSENNSIIVNVSGSGEYEYSLDGENYQTSNIFHNVESGIYTIYVNDINGCGIAQKDISLLGIPNYFTPNGDGYHDYWNIRGISSIYNAKTTIYIYDRYGKLLKEISPVSKGWDGTYNSKPLPSSDYWYNINLEDGRIIKGHFTLKR